MSSRKRFVLHALFLGVMFAVFGWFLIAYGFLAPKGISQVGAEIGIVATGEKGRDSKGSEVWFYGAFRVGDGERVAWEQLRLGPSWERRDEIYVSYENQPATVLTTYTDPLRLDFGTHPYSGMVEIQWRGNKSTVNLFAETGGVESVYIDQRSSYRDSKFYPLIVLSFFFGGVLIAAGIVLGMRNAYESVFALFLLCSLYLTVAPFFPGVYTNDSAAQLGQALTGNYENWYPPLMAWFWSVLIQATGHVESLLVFHLIMLFGGAVYWAKIFQHQRLSFGALCIPILLASPIVINFSGVVWKDVGLAFSLFLSCGILGLALLEERISVSRSVIVIALMTYAIGVRSNGIFATLPVALFFIWQIVNRYQAKFSVAKALAISATSSLILVAALLIGVQCFNYQFLKSTNQYPIQYLELYDIAGISKNSGIDYYPDYLKLLPEHDIEKISAAYVESISVLGNANNLFVFFEGEPPPLIPFNFDAELQRQLRNSWLSAIVAEPAAYWKHRWSVIDFLMSKGFYSSEQPQTNASRQFILNANSVDLGVIKLSSIDFPAEVAAKEFVYDSIVWSRGSFLYAGWFWLILLFAEFLIGLMIMQRARSGFLVVMVSTSGLLYIFPYLVVAPASDFRYLYWSSISGSILAIFIVVLAADEALKRYLRNVHKAG